MHESECKLIDRAFSFGDVVKRNLNEPESGVVVSVDTKVALRPAVSPYLTPSPNTWPLLIEDIPEAELKFVNEWNLGEFVIYKNCWLGVLDDVFREVTLKLKNGSVVVLPEPHKVRSLLAAGAFSRLEGPQNRPTAPPVAAQASAGAAPTSSSSPTSTFNVEKVLDEALSQGIQVKGSGLMTEQMAPGQTLVTTKGNLMRGRWILGTYDSTVPPIGLVVDVNTVAIQVSWLCQNMMVTGRFVPIEKPPSRIGVGDEARNMRKFTKSLAGHVDLQGNPFKQTTELSGGGELQVGDSVCFIDQEEAAKKYGFRLYKRAETTGYDLNTFAVVGTHTRVRVLWQDMTETVEESAAIVPYHNIDEHEVWPGEVVIVKPEKSVALASADLSEVPMGGLHLVPEKPDFMKPQKVGVVQSVNSAERIANVKWFVAPNVELMGGIMIPGSSTGELQATTEDVSFYDALGHQAFGMRRGDFVLIVPDLLQGDQPHEQPPDEASVQILAEEASAQGSASGGAPAAPRVELDESQLAHIAQFVERIRGFSEVGVVSSWSNALGNTGSPQFQAISRALNQHPGLTNGPINRPGGLTAQQLREAAAAVIAQPPDWLGEVVDLGLDGLVTVRLGALDVPRDVRVPIERLHVIFSEDMEPDGDFDDGDYGDDDDDGSTSSDDGIEFLGMNEPEAIEERITYEGGERLDDGGEEDWLTDDAGDADDGSDVEMADYTPAAGTQNGKNATTAPINSEPVPRTPPPIPDNVPAPEALRLASDAPSRFLVLDTPIPSDHAHKGQPVNSRIPTVTRRIAQEHKILSTSLPEGIFVRTWESRLDLMRVLIVGPLNTPYELAPFIFDFYFPGMFPTSPPVGYFHSWTHGIGRVNPNLYEDGKICLSLLGTWHAEKRGEGWSAAGSSVLQLLVSLMGLVLVREPWYSTYPLSAT